jgi:ABC-2 type transport system ATP-binding protein
MQKLADGKRTVLVSSHILSELEHISDWLIVVNDGALVYQGPAEGFLTRVPAVIALAPENLADLEKLAAAATATGHEAQRENGRVVVPVDEHEARDIAVALNKAAIERGIVLAELRLRRPTLESQYLATIGSDER